MGGVGINHSRAVRGPTLYQLHTSCLAQSQYKVPPCTGFIPLHFCLVQLSCSILNLHNIVHQYAVTYFFQGYPLDTSSHYSKDGP